MTIFQQVNLGYFRSFGEDVRRSVESTFSMLIFHKSDSGNNFLSSSKIMTAQRSLSICCWWSLTSHPRPTCLNSTRTLTFNWSQKPPRPLLASEALSLRLNSKRHPVSPHQSKPHAIFQYVSESCALVSLWATLHFQHVGVGGLSFCIHVQTRGLLCLYV